MKALATRLVARLSIRAKILGGSAVFLVLTGALGLLAISNLSAVHDKAQAVYSDGLSPVEKLCRSRHGPPRQGPGRHLRRGRRGPGRRPGHGRLPDRRRRRHHHRQPGGPGSAVADSSQTSTLADLRTQMADYQTLVDQIRTLSKAGNATDAASKLHDRRRRTREGHGRCLDAHDLGPERSREPEQPDRLDLSVRP